MAILISLLSLPFPNNSIIISRMSLPGKKNTRLVTLILLAGGSSLRMKRDKARLPVPDLPLIQRILGQVEGIFDETLISVSPGQRLDFLPCRLVEDEIEGQGPLGGILSGLRAASHDVCLVVACDIPEIPVGFLKRLLDEAPDYEIVVPSSANGFLEPLLAVYKKSVIPNIERLLASSNRQVLALFELCRTRYLEMEDSSWLRNLNTPKDYEDYIQSLQKRK